MKKDAAAFLEKNKIKFKVKFLKEGAKMSDDIQKYIVKNEDGKKTILTICYDESAISPRLLDDCVTRLVLKHRRYDLVNELGVFFNWHETKEELLKYLVDTYKPVLIFPVYMSGVSLRTEIMLDMEWDTAFVGFMLVLPGADIDFNKLKTYAIAELNLYSQYLNGEVYAYTLKELKPCACCGQDVKTETEAASCRGFVGIGTLYDYLQSEHSIDVTKLEAI